MSTVFNLTQANKTGDADDNDTDYSNSYNDVMAMYRYRSIPFSVLAVTGLLFNLLSLLVILKIRGPRTVYHALLANLAAGDALGSLLMWLYHNSVLLYPGFGDEEDRSSFKICLLKSAGLLVPLLLAMINSALALLMLSINQFLAICYPLFAQTRLPHEKVWMVVLSAWIISTCSSFVPVVAVLIQAYMDDCSAKIQYKTNTSLEICAYLLAALILIIIILYIRIYREVIRCRKRTLELSMTSRRGNPVGVQDDGAASTRGHKAVAQSREVEHNHGTIKVTGGVQLHKTLNSSASSSKHRQRALASARHSTSCEAHVTSGKRLPVDSPETNYKAFVTTILLTGTLLFFWIPYLLVSSFSIYFSDSEVEEYPDFLINLKFHVVDFLPLLTYLTDPIVYGVRIRCVRLSYARLFGSLVGLLSCRKRFLARGRRNNLNIEDGRPPKRSSYPMTSLNDFSLCA